MTQQAELLQKVETLPPKYFGEVIDFAGYLQNKARQEAAAADEVSAAAPPKDRAEKFRLTREELDEMLSRPSPLVDELSGILAGARDMTAKEIREERLEEKWQKYLSLK